VVIDLAIPNNSSIRKKEQQKFGKYQELRGELEKMWKVKATMVPVEI